MDSHAGLRRRRRTAASVATLSAATVAVALAPSAMAAAPAPVAAPAPAAGAQAVAPASVFTSGQARFEVLSPTLVRTEYAGDARFVDAPTFNAIGRDGFARTPVTTSTRDGWLVLDTGAMTLRYRVGSGRFTDQNLVVKLRTGRQDVTAQPWAGRAPVVCAVGALCEAEDLTLDGLGVATDHSGFTGSGFAAGFEGASNALSFEVAPAKAGAYELALRYANGLGEARTLTLTVDGEDARQITLPPTGGWDRWSVLPVDLALGAGPHTVALTRRSSDTGQVNIDSLAVRSPGEDYPQVPVVCDFGALCEAEGLALQGRMHVATDHTGYTGTGFAAGFEGLDDAVSFSVDAPAEGDYELTARYANGFASPGGVTVSVTGAASTPLALPSTGDWNAWGLATAPVHLLAGTNHVTVVRRASDAGNANLDSLSVGPVGSGLGTPTTSRGADCAFGTVCEAESGARSGGAVLAKDHNGFSGKGFTAGLGTAGASDTLHVVRVPAAGTYALQLRYANGLSATGSATVQVGTGTRTTVALPPTSGWDSWRTVSTRVQLAAGTDDVRISCPGTGGCGVNLDTVAVARTSAPLLAPHAPLGGYRRGLDGFDGGNGSPNLYPGLLYQDGWSLLDDTASATYDPATHTPSSRTPHAGGYQDGYVFGYGQRYEQALQDLATLTGPSKLLPRWTYGVWYSEYIDRTAADYRNTVLPRFRKEGVPLDVLVVDTDYKAVNDWDGWEYDKTRFPDPKGFFDWAKSQGLHTSLNVHPSIVPEDPQFAAAQATAKGKLTRRTSCSGGAAVCYTFDFGDPDQLRAYFQLHDQLQEAGPDFWWLDWCCDASESNLPGVTGDAWINQQYADYTEARLGRGFAFSRAFGSLQAGGYSNPTAVPTGPWADKRTTLPFTGDTTSTWGTLAAEVGFTSGESAATGLSPISHDIGGHNSGLWHLPGAEVVDGQRTDKLPDDLYARWIQFGTFQPIDRLHSNHGDRLPWQYPGAAGASATDFLRLREALLPYTYTLAREAEATGVPVVRPTYLEFPAEQEAYATAGSEYLYGSDVLVAPVTTPGTTATTKVWFPAGNSWTDWFTGRTYAGGTTRSIPTRLDTMPVFVKAGGIVPTRSNAVANDTAPLTKVTLTVAQGAAGTSSLFEDDGTTDDRSRSRTTDLRYSEGANRATLQVRPRSGGFAGEVARRSWTVRFRNAQAPRAVTVNGVEAPAGSWTWDAGTRTVTVTTKARATGSPLDVSYRWIGRL